MRKLVKATATKAGGRQSNIFIDTTPNIIGHGEEGTVHKKDVFLTRKGRYKKISMVEKIFDRQPHREWLIGPLGKEAEREYAKSLTLENQVKTMKELKDAGCHTTPTFRLLEKNGKKSILMTDFEKKGFEVADLFFNKNPEKIALIDNWSDIKKQVAEDFIRAANKGILLFPDAWIILVRVENGKRYGYPIIRDLGFSGKVFDLQKLPREFAQQSWRTYAEEIQRIESQGRKT
jgi:hypothetical protein